MQHSRQKPPFQWTLIAAFLIASAVIISTGVIYIARLKRSIVENRKNELNAIADLKAMQIVRWWHERLGDAIVLKDNNSLMAQVSEFLTSGGKGPEKEDIAILFDSYLKTFDYKRAATIVKAGKVRFSLPDDAPDDDLYLHSLIPEVTETRNVMLTDLHVDKNDSVPEIDLIIPMDVKHASENIPGDIIILTIDPDKILYPLIKSWPVPSNSGETLLIKKEGDSIIYLNPLRHNNVPPLTLRKPLSSDKLLGVQAVNGIVGTAEGLDYRNKSVIGAIKKIPGSGWYIVAKEDVDEIDHQVSDQVFPVMLLILFALVSLGAGTGWSIWHQRVRYYRQKYETELEQMALRKHFDYILKYANDIILLMDTNLIIIEVNDRALEAYQYNREEIIGTTIYNLRIPEYNQQLKDKLITLREEGRATYETVHRRKDGSTFPVEISARYFVIEGKEYFQSIGRDITERKRAELSLQVTEQTYRDLFETVDDAIYIHKPDGIFMDVNTGAEKMYGYSKSELIGMSPEVVGAPGRNDIKLIGSILKRVYETGRSEQFEFWGRRKNGEIFPKDVVVNKGKYFGEDVIIAIARDITQRIIYEEQLRSAKNKAEESDRLKTAFLHNISHEIRTPMNAIVGFTALLDEPDTDYKTRRHFIDIIYQSTNQLLGIISDIVDISNIETGQVKLNLAEVNINSIINNLYDQYKITADKQKLLIIREVILSDEKANIFTDKTKLVQILSNLLNNALKFTEQGSIVFGYVVNRSEIEFFVRDTGIGIPAEKQGRIFDRFYQVESDSSRRYSGTGLGLSICKAYVELLGGKIWLISAPGKGSEFRFSHPL